MKSEVPSTAGEASDISPRSFCAISAYSPPGAQHDLFLPRRLDERVHVVEILLERPPPGRAQPVFRPRGAAGKHLLAQLVAGILEPVRVHAQIPVRRARDGFRSVNDSVSEAASAARIASRVRS
jgi:hypothetical protein